MTVTNRPTGLRQLARAVRVVLAGGSGVLALAAVAVPLTTHAQEATAPVNEVVVTGSRIVRDGYDAPTPLTVVGGEQVQQQATPNLIDYLTTLPSFAGNYTPQSSTQNVSAGTAGTSSVNLRNLGTNRTLVLIDGQRSVPSTITGLVDINTIPQQLIERVEVVTGGASAAYGSDAVGGVVNFILDKDFTGFKTELSGGLTTHGDNENAKIAMTFGTPFAGGRGHFILSGQHTQQDGILTGDREWNKRGWQIINNPDYADGSGLPRRLLLPQIAPATATPGGIIVHNPSTQTNNLNNGLGNGTLAGLAFGQGGQTYQFNYGPLVSGHAMQGGDWESTSLHVRGQSIEPKLSGQNVFARLSYDLTDNVNLYVQSNWYANKNYSHAYPNDNYFGGLRVSVNHPYLPDDVVALARGQDLNVLELGTSLIDLGTVAIDTRREVLRNVVGVNGDFDLFGSNWTWDAYYQYGESRASEGARRSMNMVRMAEALDARIHPDTGAVVCASTLITPNNGCVPFNPFGIGVNSEAAIHYVAGMNPHRAQRFKQQAAGVSMAGTPFENWAGGVSLAFGLEHRRDSVTGVSTEADMNREFFAGNYRPTIGKYNVTEGFLETVVPLLADVPGARSLDLNAAVRFTDYSTSGSVETWKAGLTWSPIDDLRFRLTRSRDIRAPNLADLFNAGTLVNQQVVNPWDSQGRTAVTENTTIGNRNLQPEIADSLGVGVVFQPAFISGFSASVDYWEIDLADAINTITAQNIVDLCYQGNASFCANVNNGQPLVSGGVRNAITIQPFNLAEQVVRGMDIEVGYNLPWSLLDGDISVRALATRFFENSRDDTVTLPTDTAGENYSSGPPDWRWNASLNYRRDALSATLAARGVSSGVYGNAFIQCQTDCPDYTVEHPTINNNQLAGAMYLDLSLGYTFLLGSERNVEMETFLNVRNLANKDPVIAVGGPGGVPYDTVSSNASNYDTHGRVFRAGFRIKM